MFANGIFSSGETYISSYKINVSDPGSSNYSNDETVYIGNSLENATLTGTVASFDVSQNLLYIINVDGDISNAIGSELKGASSAAAGAILSVTNPEIDIFSGDTLYIENRLPIIRNVNQTEQIRMVFSF